MKNMKFAVLTFCVLVASAAAISNHWGQRSTKLFWMKDDHKIYSNNFVANPVRGFAVSRDVKFPQYATKFSQNITYIEAIDNFRNSSGGHAMIIAGGPKFNFVHLRIVSQLNQGFSFLIKIYGK
ncbi:hypothetical protein ACFFRR_007678 [Megaselia abdita]